MTVHATPTDRGRRRCRALRHPGPPFHPELGRRRRRRIRSATRSWQQPPASAAGLHEQLLKQRIVLAFRRVDDGRGRPALGSAAHPGRRGGRRRDGFKPIRWSLQNCGRNCPPPSPSWASWTSCAYRCTRA